MSKAFTREDDAAPEDDFDADDDNPIPVGSKNYLTPAGWQRMRDELRWLVNAERPEITQIVTWAAKNGDRSENGDSLHRHKRRRGSDRRVRYLTTRHAAPHVGSPAPRAGTAQ